ncbi:MAG TPA: PhoU domain-containing protein, partial [Syntrophales bacterium]|nr:PhoU domain-containing protein [Syntrophales bacterium]
MKVHTSSQYERDLKDVKESLVYLGALVEKAIDKAVKALLDRNSDLARNTIAGDRVIDRLDEEIEEKCITLLALRQPIARDLRFITTAIKINGHLE